MPSLPVYESEKNIQARKTAPAEQITQPTFKTDRTIENAMISIADEWSKAHDVMQYTEAKGKYESEVSAITTKAAQDPDFKNSDTYRTMLDKAKANSLDGINNAQVIDKLALEMDFGNQMAGIKIDSNFHQKQLAHNRFVLEQSIEGLNQKKIQATSEKEAAEYDRQIEELLIYNKATGNIDEADAEEYKDNARTSSAEYDAAVNPDIFLSRNAKWYGIQQDEWVKLKEEARNSKERAKKEGELALAEIQQENEADLTMKLVDQSIDKSSVPEITKMIRSGDITEEFGRAYLRFLTSPRSVGKGSKKAKALMKQGYYDMAKELFKAESPEETRKALIKMFDRSSSGDITEDEVSVLLKAASETNKKSLMAGILDSFAKTQHNKNELTTGFLEQVIQGKEPEEAKREAIDQQNIKNNPSRTEYAIGDMVETPMGTMYVWGYYDDGEPDVRKEKPPRK